MRKLIFAAMAGAIATVPLAGVVKAEDTTVIHKNNGYGDHKTIIKKHEDRNYVAPPVGDKKVIIHHDD
jgi:hypothetical protein